MLPTVLVLQKDMDTDIRHNALEYLGFDDSLALLTQYARMEASLFLQKGWINNQLWQKNIKDNSSNLLFKNYFRR